MKEYFRPKLSESIWSFWDVCGLSVRPLESRSVWHIRTLFYCSPLFGIHCIHCSPFSQKKKKSLSGTVFYHTYVYVAYIFILPLHANNKIKCYLDHTSPLFCITQGLGRAFLMLCLSDSSLAQEIPVMWSETALGPQRNCSKRKLF